MTTPKLTFRGWVCGFVFDNGNPCGALEDHPVHHGKWTWSLGREPDHDFLPLERRSGKDRREPEITETELRALHGDR